ncbi:adenosylcobinamide-phosphate synthase CbiB [Phaeobacter gallaeciensis]|uniref:Cobalamin biosynthesis protein CobD n=1 Tax=Phaeobacter gallaeciensis TaxID=60890 RepID=A0AAC9Z5R4_9RHOB|nr:adenosylcobinamide-phosphate synthase CbiB [Phaeobacter gallaeciensis]AHD08016.1 cobalamin biosynthesis protein CobD [Phaeobacter gallaeciensis DSM 26640]ATE91282.1 putative cobalamin biosynthesis protein CobD [Phaeobacter gallaeciensis]ATE95558.1 putative cobalamin biosynthesis protein CobD [Phaeobacter gallaeciensis]ATE99897.1 putative cobalamin biosynthesis protein CobD [Phaeobacter gallaeciensis]ATF04330.1 putative cobalamin biosynthesis protein CobD [Phaeobacter gallaeciensis]
MTTAALLIPALLLDAIFGEPRWLWSRLPHPAVLMGRAVSLVDQTLNTGKQRKARGVLAITLLVVSAGWLGWLLTLFGPLVQILIAAILLAQRSLCDHVEAVADGLRLDLTEGREAVAMIVSRDTTGMTTPQIARSAIESGAENFSDGVVAPAFWFLIGGLPGLMIYKITNTADSMIGYKTPRHRNFGWGAARLDDLLNLIPARLSALMIATVGLVLRSWPDITQDARRHRSPNAGWPEAAMARALRIALAGPRSYDGQLQDFAWVNASGSKSASAHSITQSIHLLWASWAFGLALTVAIAALL